VLASEYGLLPADVAALTPAEVSRLLEGRRVATEIEQARERAAASGYDEEEAQGRVVARESDEAMLDRLNDKHR